METALKETPKKKMGRPSVINDDDFDEFIRLPLPRYDIAKILRCSDDTLDDYCKRRFNMTFSAVQDQNRQIFRGRILAKQYELAMDGNVALLIWLGKNYVDQVDTRKIEGSEDKPLNLTYTPNKIKEAIQIEVNDGKNKLESKTTEDLQSTVEDGREEGEG